MPRASNNTNASYDSPFMRPLEAVFTEKRMRALASWRSRRWARYIRYVGLEFEGAWLRDRGLNVYGDGSVNIYPPDEEEYTRRTNYNDGDNEDDDTGACYDGAYVIGETSSSPLAPGCVKDWVRINHPDLANGTCGLHVHLSFLHPTMYAVLADLAFYTSYFLPGLSRFAARTSDRRLASRLRGENNYCNRTHAPLAQYHGDMDRYTQLNWCSMSEHNTIECRVFPMTTLITHTRQSIATYINLVCAYLDAAYHIPAKRVIAYDEISLEPDRHDLAILRSNERVDLR